MLEFVFKEIKLNKYISLFLFYFSTISLILVRRTKVNIFNVYVYTFEQGKIGFFFRELKKSVVL